MEPQILIDVLSRWVHIGTTIVLVGGTIFMRCVLMPAATATLGDSQHAALRDQLIARWKKFVMIGIALLLITGLYNYIAVAIPRQKGNGLYHGLMGTKILLALAVFFLASVLTGRSPAFDGVRQNRARWMSVLILLAALIIGIAGFLKIAVPPQASADAAAADSTDTPAGDGVPPGIEFLDTPGE
jgi:uncharacterized membrane protein